ncbi:MAG TPA: zinc-ribbon domain-containing protein [Ktedonobacterales bacterium]|nr:zinc-ribbon domain-containing protein [Ktedonobacterales bacterium]
MICSNCGARIERGSTECPQCGAIVRGPRYGLRRTFGAPAPRPARTRPSWRPSTLGQFVRKAPGGEAIGSIGSLGRNLISRVNEQLGRHQAEDEPPPDLSAGLSRLPRRAPGTGGNYDSFGPERDSFGPEPGGYGSGGYGEPRRAPRTPYAPQRGGGTPQRGGPTPYGGPQRSGPTPYANPQRSGPTPYDAPQAARVPGYGAPQGAVRYGPADGAALDDPWSSVAQPPATPQSGQPQRRGGGMRGAPKGPQDMFLDTGQGWSVAVPPAEPASYTGYYGAQAERPPSAGMAVLRLFGGSVRALFNFVIVVFAILFLAVPVLIGLQRIGALHVLDVAKVTQPPARAIPTAPAGFQTYVTPSFALAFPGTWRYTQTTRTLGSWGTAHDGHVEDAAALVGATITTLATVPKDQHEGLLDANTTSWFGNRAANIITTSAPNSTLTLDGASWLKETFTFDLATGQQSRAMRGLALVTSQGLSTYIILLYAPADKFDSVNAQQFSVTLASFRFVP